MKLLSIGAFAKLKGVSVKSLRYYDRIGILKPAYVDPDTKYRYYAPEQMILLDLIQLCLTFHLPLKSLSGYCGTQDPAPDLKKIIADGQIQARAKLREAEKTLRLSDDILEQIQRLNQPRQEKVLYSQSFAQREVLTCPWDPVRDDGTSYMNKIGLLHQTARDLGLTILSQQGILHDYDPDRDSVFLAVEGSDGSSVRLLPQDAYTCMVLKEQELTHVPELLHQQGIQPKFSLYLNTDIYDYCLSHHLHWMEVQSFESSI